MACKARDLKVFPTITKMMVPNGEIRGMRGMVWIMVLGVLISGNTETYRRSDCSRPRCTAKMLKLQNKHVRICGEEFYVVVT